MISVITKIILKIFFYSFIYKKNKILFQNYETVDVKIELGAILIYYGTFVSNVFYNFSNST